MAAPRRPDPPPYETNEFAPVIVATAIWAIGFVVVAAMHHSLARHGHGWYEWVGLSGFLLGLWGLTLMLLRRHLMRKAQSRSASASSSAGETAPSNNSDAR
jgi:Protein of unknown function (DUF2530)